MIHSVSKLGAEEQSVLHEWRVESAGRVIRYQVTGEHSVGFDDGKLEYVDSGWGVATSAFLVACYRKSKLMSTQSGRRSLNQFRGSVMPISMRRRDKPMDRQQAIGYEELTRLQQEIPRRVIRTGNQNSASYAD